MRRYISPLRRHTSHLRRRRSSGLIMIYCISLSRFSAGIMWYSSEGEGATLVYIGHGMAPLLRYRSTEYHVPPPHVMLIAVTTAFQRRHGIRHNWRQNIAIRDTVPQRLCPHATSATTSYSRGDSIYMPEFCRTYHSRCLIGRHHRLVRRRRNVPESPYSRLRMASPPPFVMLREVCRYEMAQMRYYTFYGR